MKKLNDMQRLNFAFTLAEVLITLGIIGIIAVITIPNLISNSQKHQYVAQLKKAYSVSNSTLTDIMREYGSVGDLEGTGLFSPQQNCDGMLMNEMMECESGNSKAMMTNFSNAFKKNIKIAKDCGTSSTECFPDETLTFYSGDNSSTMNLNSEVAYRFISVDGTAYEISLVQGCTAGDASNTTVCGFITFDVNGRKPPNTFGRDTFRFSIAKKGFLHPFGSTANDNTWNWRQGNDPECGVHGITSGYYCAGRIMEEGWQMNY